MCKRSPNLSLPLWAFNAIAEHVGIASLPRLPYIKSRRGRVSLDHQTGRAIVQLI